MRPEYANQWLESTILRTAAALLRPKMSDLDLAELIPLER
jgi:hypothetical protein